MSQKQVKKRNSSAKLVILQAGELEVNKNPLTITIDFS